MQLQVMLLNALPAAHQWSLGNPVVARASLGIPDTLAIFVVALVVFGPKRLPEIGKQIGKLVFEFRRASNDFKLQIEEELRLSEQQDRQKVLDMQAAANKPATPVALSAESSTSAVSSTSVVASEASPASGFEAMQGTAPQPPDRTGALNGANLNPVPPTASPEIVSTAPEVETGMVTPEPQAPLTIQPPSTGTLVSALPPNHAAKNVMTAIPPASATPEAAAEVSPIPSDTTAHNG